LDVYGNIIGTHDGAWFYTIGQRRGIGYHKQVYVISTNVHDNTITVSENSLDDHLLFNGLVCRQWHWVNKKYDNIVECEVKVRYRQKPQKATIYQKNNSVYCFFYDQQRALAP
jgi:tRNA-specific 2-thiouridylase